MECLRADSAKREVLAFLLSDEVDWDATKREDYEYTLANTVVKPTLTSQDVDRNVKQLHDFKSWLKSRAFQSEFTSPDDLKAKIAIAVRD